MSPRAWVLFVALSVVWGIPYLMIKVAVDGGLHPAVVVSLRCGLGAAVMLPFAVARGQLASLKGLWGWIPVFALAEIAVPFLLLTAAEIRLTSSLVGLLVAMVPLMAAVTSRLTGLEHHLGPVRIAGLLVGLLGVALLVGLDVRGGDLLGVLAVVVAAAGYVAGPFILETRLKQGGSFAVISAAMAVAALVTLPWAVIERPAVGEVPAEAWASVLGLGLICSALAFVLFFALVGEVGPARASVITYVNPLVALLLGVWLLSEPVTAGVVVGFPIVLIGSYLATRRSRRAAAGPAARPVTAS